MMRGRAMVNMTSDANVLSKIKKPKTRNSKERKFNREKIGKKRAFKDCGTTKVHTW